MARPVHSKCMIAGAARYGAVLFAVAALSGCGKSAEQRAAEEAAMQQRVKIAAQAELEANQRKLIAIARGEQASTPMPTVAAEPSNSRTEVAAPAAVAQVVSVDTRPLLWHNARYGMSVAEVQAAVPEARPSTNYQPLVNGARSLLTVESVELFSKPFEARFYFDGDTLIEVMLTLTPEPTASEGKTTFDQLRTALRSKYGSEIDTGGTVNSVGSIINPTWVSGATNIELLYISIGGGNAVVNVVYQVRVRKEAAKL